MKERRLFLTFYSPQIKRKVTNKNMLTHEEVVVEENGRCHTIVSYIRERWHEWLWVEVSEGYAVPHFYLPTYRHKHKLSMVCWIIPLAPFVLVFVALKEAFWHFWMDCVWMVDKWRKRDLLTPPKTTE